MERKRTVGAVPPPTDRKSQSLQDQQFKQRRRIAERLVQAFRNAGYSCEVGDDTRLKRKN
jgi:hypothetical protein